MSGGYVFVSYSRQQYYVAEQIAASLSANGLPAWLDAQEIAPGADWQAAIDQGIAHCAAFVLVASRSAYRSAAVQHEIAAALAAGKPIYLAVIQNCPLVQRFQDVKDEVSIVDCRFQFEQQITTLARAIQTGQPHHDTISGRLLGDTMPFGRAKYLQLLFVALSYTVGTLVLLINKQAIINHTLPQQLMPLLVLIAAPASAWLIVLFYSWYLVVAFRLQRPVSFTALEIWPVLNLVLIPALFFFLDLGI
ncbi:MAG: toll/interleukin-1 receptor domain-containing protein, partial [Nitrososphaerota archaeon]